MRHCGTVHVERCRIAGLPENLSGSGVERAHDLVLLLPREQIDPVADDERRGVPESDLDLPTLSEYFRPDPWFGEGGKRPIPVRPSPLRPILRDNVTGQ